MKFLINNQGDSVVKLYDDGRMTKVSCKAGKRKGIMISSGRYTEEDLKKILFNYPNQSNISEYQKITQRIFQFINNHIRHIN